MAYGCTRNDATLPPCGFQVKMAEAEIIFALIEIEALASQASLRA